MLLFVRGIPKFTVVKIEEHADSVTLLLFVLVFCFEVRKALLKIRRRRLAPGFPGGSPMGWLVWVFISLHYFSSLAIPLPDGSVLPFVQHSLPF